MSQPKTSKKRRNGSNGNGKNTNRVKPFAVRKLPRVRQVSVPSTWEEFMHAFDTTLIGTMLKPNQRCQLPFPCGSRIEIAFDEKVSSLRFSILSANQNAETTLASSGVNFSDQFEDGFPSYAFISLVILAVAIEIEMGERLEEDFDILSVPTASGINDFLRNCAKMGGANDYPSEDVMKLFVSSGYPRVIRTKGGDLHSYKGVSICLLGFQTMLISVGLTPKEVWEMSHLDLSQLPNVLVNALMGIIYAIILDEKLMHASIDAHLKSEGGPKQSKV